METRGRKKLIQTEDEKKAKAKASALRWYYRNKEEQLLKSKEWRKNNEGYFQEYYQNNKEYYNNKSKETYNNDKEKWYKRNRANLDKHNTGEYHVYKIDSAKEYVGLTTNMYTRMSRHKHDGRDISNVRILSSFGTYKEARELESFLHQLGYPGSNKII